MKPYILLGCILAAASTVTLSGCNDDDTIIYENSILSKVETGSADVTATAATVHGTVLDLSSMTPSRYQVGVVYSTSSNPLAAGNRQPGAIDADGNMTATITGLTKDITYYYATYVSLQGIVTEYGEVKQFTTTDALVATADAVSINDAGATLGGTLSDVDDLLGSANGTLVYGLLLAPENASDDFRKWNRQELSGDSNSFTYELKGLMPSTTYRYTAFMELNGTPYYGTVKTFTTATTAIEWVDMGLSVLWAGVNLGATAPEQTGGLYGYGDLYGLNRSIDNSDYADGNISGRDADPAKTADAGRLPSQAEFNDLFKYCNPEQYVLNGVAGWKFTAANGNSIFLPATGVRNGEEITATDKGAYWTGNAYSTHSDYAMAASLSASGARMETAPRHSGLALRPVKDKETEGMAFNPYLIGTGDLEGNGNYRIQIYNMYGGGDPAVNPADIHFTDEISVTFSISGISSKAPHQAYIGFAAADWSFQNWEYKEGQGTIVNGDGTYTVRLKGAATNAAVFVVDIKDLSKDCGGADGITATVLSIKTDDWGRLIPFVPAMVGSGDLEGNGNFRMQLFNMYGGNPAIEASQINFRNKIAVTFSISGISSKTPHQAYIGYATSDWSFQNWEYKEGQGAIVNGDGTYTVSLNGSAKDAAVFVVDIKDLSKDCGGADGIKAEVLSVRAD